MSFFFSKQERKKKPDRVKALGSYGCNACPLNKAEINSPKMNPTVKPSPILVIGEAPGAQEDDQGAPFVGPSGKLIREVLPVECSFDNVINCHPKGNRTPVPLEVECCRSRRVKVIEDLKPKLIIGLGATALHWMTGSADITGYRGRVIPVKIGSHSCHFMASYHPSFVLRMAHNKKNPLTSKFGHCLRMDVERACAQVNQLVPVDIPTESEIRDNVYWYCSGNGSVANPHRGHGKALDEGSLFQLLARAKAARIKAIDIETTGIRPYATGSKILSVALSFDDVNFAFTLEREDVKAYLREILSDKTIKVAHNSVFECEWLAWFYGPDVIRHLAWECTQLQAHFLDERNGDRGDEDDGWGAKYLGLDFLCKLHFGFSFKHLFKVNRKDMASSDTKEMLIYNGVDTKLTLRLYHHQSKLLKEAGLYDTYKQAVPRQAATALMQFFGIGVDQSIVKELQFDLTHDIAHLDNQIKDLDVVQKYNKTNPEFNPLSVDDAIVVFRDYLKRKEIHVKDGEKLRLSTSKNILEKIDHPLAKLIVQLRNKTKMKSTYVDGLELGSDKAVIWPDGKLHPNFHTTSTTTGRLSSSKPNGQNFPHRDDAWVRRQIIAGEGNYIVAADFGQLEACTAAMCSKDPVLVKALWEDVDVHMQWASRMAVLCPDSVGDDFGDPSVAKAFRSRIKNKLVFPAIFGATNNSISDYLTIDISFIDEIMDEFWGVFSGVKSWQDRIIRNYYETGYVESPTGRRRHYPMTRNEAINASIQGLASDIVVDAMVRLSIIAKNKGWHLHPRLNIHDDISLVVPEKLVEDSIQTVYRTMLSPSFPCVNVPLSVSVSIGRNWFEMEEIGKFWSHKDLG